MMIIKCHKQRVLLEFVLSDESVHLDAKDTRVNLIEIDFGTVRRDFLNDNRPRHQRKENQVRPVI